MYNLYGIRKEFFIEDKKEVKDAVLLLLKDSFKYEFSVKRKFLRKVQGFIAPEYISKDRHLKLDLKLFLEKESFELKEFAYDTKSSEGNIIPEISINPSFFKEVKSIRNMKERPVWIFCGNSGLGKSYIGTFLAEYKDVYETDSSDRLPEVIYSDIIILGNKYNFTKEDVINRLYGKVKLIEVKFS